MSEARTRVIVVEDEPQIRRFVCEALRREGCAPVQAGTARQGLDEAAMGKTDLVILDLGLPDMDGIEFIRELRAWSRTPILILSARTGEKDKIAALDAGADDYLAKPFGIGELLARTRALLRRTREDGQATPYHEFGTVKVDLSRHLATRDGAEIHLTQMEYRLLTALLAGSGKVMTQRQLMQEVWGQGYAGQTHYLRIYVARLRQKLEADPAQPQHFLTETGIGYRFQP